MSDITFHRMGEKGGPSETRIPAGGTAMKRPRVLLADDHWIVLEGIQSMLIPHCDIVGMVDNGRDLLAVAKREHPDVVVVDVSMPQLNGIDAVRELKKQDERCKVIFLTMHNDPTFVAAALRAGASGYVVKSSAASELLKAVQEVLEGRTYLEPSLTKGAISELVLQGTARKSRVDLTTRQHEVLQLISEGLPLKEIAGILNISLSTVQFHKMVIMRRLEMNSTAELVKYAVAHGISPA